MVCHRRLRASAQRVTVWHRRRWASVQPGAASHPTRRASALPGAVCHRRQRAAVQRAKVSPMLLPVSERAEAASTRQRPVLARVAMVWSRRLQAWGPGARLSLWYLPAEGPGATISHSRRRAVVQEAKVSPMLLPVSERAEAASRRRRPVWGPAAMVWSPRLQAWGPVATVWERAAEPWRPAAPPKRRVRWRCRLTPATACRSVCRLSRHPKSLRYPVSHTTHAMVRGGRLIAATFQCQLTIIAERRRDEQHGDANALDNHAGRTEYGRMAGM
jgi:hypothetical protein